MQTQTTIDTLIKESAELINEFQNSLKAKLEKGGYVEEDQLKGLVHLSTHYSNLLALYNSAKHVESNTINPVVE